MENLLFLGVPILEHIRVTICEKKTFLGFITVVLASHVSHVKDFGIVLQVHLIICCCCIVVLRPR